MIHAFKAGDYYVTLNINNSASNSVKVSIGEDVRIGVLTDYSGNNIVIDSATYPISYDFDFNYKNSYNDVTLVKRFY